MSTRGAYGFRVDNKDYVSYNHCDSYPECLGEEVLKVTQGLVVKHSIEELKEKVRSIKLVDINGEPTKKEVEQLKQYLNLDVGNQKPTDWYCLLREQQGYLLSNLECGYMLDSSKFLLDSIFCEWAYIINLDDEVLEVYKGFMHKKGDGRYDSIMMEKMEGFDDSYGVSLVLTYPLSEITKIKSLAAMVKSLIDI